MSGKNGVSLRWGGLDRAIGSALQHMVDRQLLMESVGEALVSSTKQRFIDSKDPEGKTWEPSGRAWQQGLSGKKKEKRGKQQSGQFGKTLNDTGRLRDSVDYASTSDSVHVGSAVDSATGSNVKYARIHQKGGQAGKGHSVRIPARPYLGFSKEDREEVQALITDFLKGAFRK